jgi:exonuclease SbcC
MRIEKLVIDGVLAFRERMELDLRSLAPGVVAVWGGNGEGKTTVLESPLAAVYRTMPSRSSKPLAAYAHHRKASIMAEISVAGRGLYRSKVSLDSQTRGSDALLEHIDGAGVVTRLNDGKLKTFDAAVAQVFPPLELVLASAFGAQKRTGSFVDLGPADRKSLFARLLGLERFEQLAAAAAAAARLCVDHQQALEARRSGLQAGLQASGDLAALQAQLAGHDRDLVWINEEIATASSGLRLAEDEVSALLVAIEASAPAVEANVTRRARLAAVLRERDQLPATLAALEARLAADVAEAVRVRDVALAQVAAARDATPTAEALAIAADVRRDKERTAVADRRASLASDRDAYEADLRAHQALEPQRVAAVVAAAQAESAAGLALAAAEAALREARASLDEATALVVSLAAVPAAVAAARGAAALLGEVPCAAVDAALAPACRLAQGAVVSRDALPALEEQLAELAAAQSTALISKLAADQAAADVVTLRSRLDEAKAAAVTAGMVRSDFEVQATRKVEALAICERQLSALDADLEARLAAIEAELAASISKAADLERSLDAREAETLVAYEAAAGRLQADAARVRADRLALDTTLAAEQADLEARLVGADALEEQLAADRARRSAAEAVVASRRDTLSALRGNLERSEANRTALADLVARVEAMAAEVNTLTVAIAGWTARVGRYQTMARCFGRDGLPVLEIANAGPAVSAICNDLLESVLGHRFTVELVTQVAKQDGSGTIETFAVRVFDADRGGVASDLSELSGGEEVLVDEALKAALALYVNSRFESPVETCWRDETTGALDLRRSRLYVDMLRRVRERGGFGHLFYITHNLDAALAADAVLLVRGGRVEVLEQPVDPQVLLDALAGRETVAV